MEIFITMLAAWFIADVIAGGFHWWQDRYLTTDRKWKWVLAINEANDLHHVKPGAMAAKPFLETVKTTAPWLWTLAAILFFTGAPTVIWLAFFLGGFANQVHKWSHTAKNKLHWSIRLMQHTGLFISHEHHAEHHYNHNGVIKKENTLDIYCPMSNYMNPILDFIKFWQGLEYIISLAGIHPTKRTN